MKKRYVVVMASLLSLTSWIGFSNATVNTEQLASHQAQTASLVDVLIITMLLSQQRILLVGVQSIVRIAQFFAIENAAPAQLKINTKGLQH